MIKLKDLIQEGWIDEDSHTCRVGMEPVAQRSNEDANAEVAALGKVKTVDELDKILKRAGDVVDGREVMEGPIPNTDSISASLYDYEELPGLREVPMDLFGFTGRHYSKQGSEKRERLAASIKESGRIMPLIVVIDREGAYVLEGATRGDALKILKAKSFPAMVVLDKEGIEQDSEMKNSNGTIDRILNGK